MDVYFPLNGITFVWSDQKAKANPLKHDGITFPKAAEAFFDPLLVVVDASRNDEARDAVVALDKRWNLLIHRVCRTRRRLHPYCLRSQSDSTGARVL
ncbi:MAG: BrnT family toxin [Phormidesmis sp.]